MVKEFLGQNIRVQISDGRMIEGEFQCLDRQLNIILGSATEYHSSGLAEFDANSTTSRSLGMAIIPGNSILKCFVTTK